MISYQAPKRTQNSLSLFNQVLNKIVIRVLQMVKNLIKSNSNLNTWDIHWKIKECWNRVKRTKHTSKRYRTPTVIRWLTSSKRFTLPRRHSLVTESPPKPHPWQDMDIWATMANLIWLLHLILNTCPKNQETCIKNINSTATIPKTQAKYLFRKKLW